MSAKDNNYNEILEEITDKLNSFDSIKEIDMLEIKNSVESIESLITDTQAKLNFSDIKEKLETISLQVDNCNEALLKDLFNDINELKEKSADLNTHLENIQNVQNLSLTSAEFEEFQKQQLDLALKTNENIFNELNVIKENALAGSSNDNLKNLESQLATIHSSLTEYIEKMMEKVEVVPSIDDIGSVITDVQSVNLKSIKQTNTLLKTIESNFSGFKNKEFSEQIAKISEIYDSLNIIHAWIEKVGLLNKSIENVYARLGSNIDFDDVAEKIDVVFENISELNNWTRKIDSVDENMIDVQGKIASLSSCLEDTKNISNAIVNIKSKLDATLSEDLDLDDLSTKMDIVYENLTAINEWAIKVDTITEKVSSLETSMNSIVEEEMITSKIDLIYDNIGLLNEWVQRIDGVAQKSEELDTKLSKTNDDLNIKLDEITQTLSNAGKIIADVPDIKDRLDELSKELNLITRTTKNETESYIYTLLDIESDFLKLHKFLDDKTEQTSQDINSLKEKFEELNDDISSISKRTNKLILSADDANKEFKTYLEMFRKTINELDNQKQDFNPKAKFELIGRKLSNINALIQNSLTANNNLNTAFIYLAEWVDATGAILNTMQSDLASVKAQTDDNTPKETIASIKEEISFTLSKINDIEESFANYKNNDVSEIKSLISGIVIQLDTTLTQKFEQLAAVNNEKISAIETKLKETIEVQARHILTLENKITELNEKLDKLTENLPGGNNNELKDILNYIATQITASNESLTKQQSINNTIAQQMVSFDENINKLVSYIEED